MPDLSTLATKLAKDKGYTGGSPTDSGLKGFVCPRANAYGGREGIIPPGVAVRHGLVPRGMKHIAVADTAKAANAASEDGKTEAERYLEYYGGRMTAAPEAPVSTPPPVTPVPSVPVQAPASSSVAAPTTAAVDTPVSDPGTPADPGVFSRTDAAPAPDDTLDGFYAGLKGAGYGTDESPARPRTRSRRPVAPTPVAPAVSIVEAGNGRFRSEAHDDRPVRAAGMDFGREEPPAIVESEDGRINRVDRVPAPVPPSLRPPAPEIPENDLVWRGGEAADLHSPEYRRMAEELAQYKQAVAEMYRKVDEQAAVIQSLRAARTARPAETVRVILSQDEQKLKVGGETWECRILGALNRNITGDDLVLSVSDPRYASELLSELRPGPVSILSGGGRTDCAYRGNCVKIYGEADSPDFITLFRFTLSPDGG